MLTATGSAPTRSPNNATIESCASQPSPRLESVTPSWLADKARVILDVAFTAIRASLSPLRTMASSRVRLDLTMANSAATKNPFRRMSATMASNRVVTGGRYHISQYAVRTAGKSTEAIPQVGLLTQATQLRV